ncbi:MAG: enoyl-CoA hydratase/isomerase family protein [Actinomycetota bacterium]|nr:enoyl-CoA hydratase/isomerase family protein [Actinomycetota bacterium]
MSYETLLYEEKNAVAWITLNRPDLHNAFNSLMQQEMRDVWRSLRANDSVNAVVLTGAGEKAFCTGIDRREAMDPSRDSMVGSPGATPFMFDDPGEWLGPKSNDMWKPVIGAINGMAAAGAFYMLGEVDIIIAAESATFFDPHVSYGMTSSFESMHMLQRMPLGEVIRMQLMGNFERLSAKRAYEIGLVSEIAPDDKLRDAAAWVAETIAAQPPLAVQGTLRAIWAAQEMSRRDALAAGYAFVKMGTDEESLREGQKLFSSGERPKWRLR